MFPYLPPHVTRPKEMRRVFMVQVRWKYELNYSFVVF